MPRKHAALSALNMSAKLVPKLIFSRLTYVPQITRTKAPTFREVCFTDKPGRQSTHRLSEALNHSEGARYGAGKSAATAEVLSAIYWLQPAPEDIVRRTSVWDPGTPPFTCNAPTSITVTDPDGNHNSHNRTITAQLCASPPYSMNIMPSRGQVLTSVQKWTTSGHMRPRRSFDLGARHQHKPQLGKQLARWPGSALVGGS